MNNDKRIVEAFLKEHADLYKTFKANFLEKETAHKEKMASERQRFIDMLEQLKKDYTNYHGLLNPDILDHLNLPPPNILNFNSLFQQGYIIHLFQTILKAHECTPITFNEANGIPVETDTTYWAYNPSLHHTHWLALLNQLKSHKEAWKWFKEAYHCNAYSLYTSERFKEFDFHSWFITFFHWVAMRSIQV